MLDVLRSKGQMLKNCMKEFSCVHMIRVISILPKIGGFPLMTEKIFVLFWILHLLLAVYVYVVGVTFYQIYISVGPIDAVSSIFNILIVSVILNNSLWFLLKRKEINTLLVLAQANDALVNKEGRFLDIYKSLMLKTKRVIVTCYCFHFVNDVMVFIPTRIFDMSSFSIVSCVGLEPLTVSPNREACMLILASQELTSTLVVAGYDVIILFLYSYMTTIFIILSEDMESFCKITDKFDNSAEMRLAVDKRLKSIIVRHSLVLLTVNKLQNLFSIAIGVVLVLNTISVCAFFVLPLEAANSFGPLIYYTQTVFFLYCLLGQRLSNASERFEMAVYCCGWEKLPLSQQKIVLLMLKQAQKPVVLYAAGMVPICMTTFASTMQAIYKFITVFRV